MNRMKDKAAIVTGGAMGIGRADCIILAREGAMVAVCDIDDTAGKKVVAEIRKNGGRADYWHLDVTDEKAVEKTFADIYKKYGKINVLVNNAGIPGTGKPSHLNTVEEFEKVLNIDVKGVFRCTKHVYAYMKKSGGGSIINMSSMLGIIGGGDPVYHAAKGAVRLLTKGDAGLYGKDNIRVNSVHPGFIVTPGLTNMIEERDPGTTEAFLKGCVEKAPLGRTGTPEDIANGVLFLASDESSFVTGSELVIDGGVSSQ